MKRLIVILGPNGVGKTTVASELLRTIPNSAFVDSDYLRKMNPGENSEELIRIQKANILSVMENYLSSSIIENVVFTYGLHGHREKMLNDIISEISNYFKTTVIIVVLTCVEKENIRRMQNDGRDPERIKRAIVVSRPIYENTGYFTIDTTAISPKQVAEIVRGQIFGVQGQKVET